MCFLLAFLLAFLVNFEFFCSAIRLLCNNSCILRCLLKFIRRTTHRLRLFAGRIGQFLRAEQTENFVKLSSQRFQMYILKTMRYSALLCEGRYHKQNFIFLLTF